MGVPIRLDDGTVVLAELKPGVELTEQDKLILKEFAQFLRDKSDKAKKPAETPSRQLKGKKRAPQSKRTGGV